MLKFTGQIGGLDSGTSAQCVRRGQVDNVERSDVVPGSCASCERYAIAYISSALGCLPHASAFLVRGVALHHINTRI